MTVASFITFPRLSIVSTFSGTTDTDKLTAPFDAGPFGCVGKLSGWLVCCGATLLLGDGTALGVDEGIGDTLALGVNEGDEGDEGDEDGVGTDVGDGDGEGVGDGEDCCAATIGTVASVFV